MPPSAITDLSQLDTSKLYTYADYLLWRLEERIELIKGRIFRMSPAPGQQHQRISMRFTKSLLHYLDRSKSGCELFSAPFDVRLPDSRKAKKSDQDIYTVVQPDLCVICDAGMLDERGCIGAPDLIVEILSPGNSRKEMKIKYELYEENGVKEYWIVAPGEHFVMQFVLSEAGKYEFQGNFAEDDVLCSHVFPDLEVDLAGVFAQ